MPNNKYYWSGDKAERIKYAEKHTQEMDFRFAEEIENTAKNTKFYGYGYYPYNGQWDPKVENTVGVFSNADSVEAIMRYAEVPFEKTAVLNFASFLKPGGEFINGSRAQEECLCAKSFLYNVLNKFDDKYYAENEKHRDRGLYANKAFYTPNIIFEDNDKRAVCDVITCAAPNQGVLRWNSQAFTPEENTKALDSRIHFILDIAAENNVENLILGAYGCGVFRQDPTEVATIFKKYLQSTHKNVFKQVIFAVPNNIHPENYEAMRAVLMEGKNNGN